MYYADLENYRFQEKEFSHIENIGWLDITHDFTQGEIDKKLLQKLYFLTCQMYDQPSPLRRKQKRKLTKPILIVHTNFMRMLPFKCPFCESVIAIKTDKAEDIQLGVNEMEISNSQGNYLYNFPTMLYHHISEHQYLPPSEFLESLQDFDLTKDFDCNDFYNQLKKRNVKNSIKLIFVKLTWH